MPNPVSTRRLLLAALVCSNLAHAQQPNIVFIMADDLGWADTSTGLTNLGDASDLYPKFAALAGASLPGGQSHDRIDLSSMIADSNADAARDAASGTCPGT